MTTPNESAAPQLQALAHLIDARNAIGRAIAAMINRPASTGNIGEYIASQVFDVTLHPAANHVGSDGICVRTPTEARTST